MPIYWLQVNGSLHQKMLRAIHILKKLRTLLTTHGAVGKDLTNGIVKWSMRGERRKSSQSSQQEIRPLRILAVLVPLRTLQTILSPMQPGQRISIIT